MNLEISELRIQKKCYYVFIPILMKLGEVIVHMGTTISPSVIKIGIKTKSFIQNSTFLKFLIHLFVNSLLDDPAQKWDIFVKRSLFILTTASF